MTLTPNPNLDNPANLNPNPYFPTLDNRQGTGSSASKTQKPPVYWSTNVGDMPSDK